MKSFKMNKMLGSIKRISTVGPSSDSASDPQGDGPEAIAARSVRAFCESGGGESTGDEVTFLPPIVESAESSPAAAAECARIIRKYLNRDYWSKPSYQYNSIMLMRILADNPGMTFTRNLDKKFIDTAKELLRTGRDPSVRQMMMETLDSFEAMKEYDEGLGPLIEMWRKEKEKAYKAYGGRPPAAGAGAGAPRTLNAPPFDPHSQNYFSRSHRGKSLPEPVELANRLEEARTSAKLLTQVVSCTPPSEVLSNELIREFADRCVSASRSIQGYMTSREPAPDNDTMESLLDTNEQLQQALNLHQRSVLNARKHLGIGDRSENSSPAPPPGPPPQQQNSGGASTALPPPPLPSRAEKPSKGKSADLPPLPPVGGGATAAGPSRSTNGTPRPAEEEEEEDPFRDPQPESSRSSSKVRGHVGTGGGGGGGSSAFAAGGGGGPPELAEPKFAHEPFHPGFGAGESIYQSSGYAKRDAAQGGGAAGYGGGADVSPVTTAAEGNSPERTRRERREEDSDLYDDGEGSYPGYEAGSKNKQPMYRY